MLKISSQEEYESILKNATYRKFEDYDPNINPKQYIDIDISFYYQCYKNKRATEFVLENCRKHFPKEKIYLICDGGEDFTDLADKYSCDYTYDEENIGISNLGISENKILSNRFKKACKQNKSEWIIVLEDDVYVRDIISKYPNAHIGGDLLHVKIGDNAKNYFKNKWPNNEYDLCGCSGGAILYCDKFLEYDEEKFPFKEIRKIDIGLLSVFDITASTIIFYYGGIQRKWIDRSEELGGLNIFGDAAAFDHQYKKYYEAK